MAEPARKGAVYQDLYEIPKNMTGEIVAGELIVTPRPSRRHSNASFALSSGIGPPYRFGRGGPGGWIILAEPEVSFGQDILVPDLGGWKKERFPISEDHNWISAAPDWVCEILSPSTARTDKADKMPIYAAHGVSYLWLVDPLAETLDVFGLEAGRWVVLGLFAGAKRVRAKPFHDMELDLGTLWLGEEPVS